MRNIIREVENLLNKEIIIQWELLKKRGHSFIDNESDSKLSIEIHFETSPEKEQVYSFTFNVVDKSKSEAGKEFDFLNRSKGFKWFFTFIFKLKYNPDYLNDKSGALFLLDEPGSFLHSSAQEGLLEKLKDLSKGNQIIFCTHSQYFLDPSKINISNVKIVNKEKGTINVHNFNETDVSKYSGAWAPLYHALHLSSGVHIFENSNFSSGVNKIIISEGIIDYYFFMMLKSETDLIKNTSVKFLPGAGAGNLKELISFSIASAEKYLVLLDSDASGDKGYERYTKYFGMDEAKNFYQYKLGNGQNSNKVKLEDLLSNYDQKKIKDITTCDDIKKAIISMYFNDTVTKKGFWGNIDTLTLSNLSAVLERINAL